MDAVAWGVPMASFEINLDDSQEKWDELLAEIERRAERPQEPHPHHAISPDELHAELQGIDDVAAFLWGGLWIR